MLKVELLEDIVETGCWVCWFTFPLALDSSQKAQQQAQQNIQHAMNRAIPTIEPMTIPTMAPVDL